MKSRISQFTSIMQSTNKCRKADEASLFPETGLPFSQYKTAKYMFSRLLTDFIHSNLSSPCNTMSGACANPSADNGVSHLI